MGVMVGDWLIGNANDVLLDSFMDAVTQSMENDVEAYMSLCSAGPVLISNATNASPIVITTSTAHGLTTGDVVTVVNVGGNGAAKGTFDVTVTNTTTFSLDDSTGDGTYTGGGEVYKCVVGSSAIAFDNIGAGQYLATEDGTVPLTESQSLTLVIYCLGAFRDLYNCIVPVTARRRST